MQKLPEDCSRERERKRERERDRERGAERERESALRLFFNAGKDSEKSLFTA